MPGGRPATSAHEGSPELAELAAWFGQALTDSEYRSINDFVQRQIIDKHRVYQLANGTRLLTLDAVRDVARRLRRDPAEVEPVWFRAREASEHSQAAAREAALPAARSQSTATVVYRLCTPEAAEGIRSPGQRSSERTRASRCRARPQRTVWRRCPGFRRGSPEPQRAPGDHRRARRRQINARQ